MEVHSPIERIQYKDIKNIGNYQFSIDLESYSYIFSYNTFFTEYFCHVTPTLKVKRGVYFLGGAFDSYLYTPEGAGQRF